jgi:glutamate-ammonia-ligase adenylyltransferase
MTPTEDNLQLEEYPGVEAKLRAMEIEVISAGIPPSDFFLAFLKELRATPDPERALNNFMRFISSGFTSSLLREFSAHPVLLNVALTLFSHSQYLADILVRNTELFHWLTATAVLTSPKSAEEYRADALNAIESFDRTDKKLDALKRLQRREILRISARDILKEAPLTVVTNELSWLADALVDATLYVSVQELNLRLGSEVPSTLAVIGLGKLGGSELNFSSDIDLMFVYDADGDLEYQAERIYSLHQFYCRIAEQMVRRLSERTNEGHLYRVDMRLRPDGSSGPLAMSREGFVRYYETRGELWERQMLLKARVIAGNRATGEALLNDLRPFVYPGTSLRDPRDEIRTIKNAIEARLRDEKNVKLSKGGIRDIEFTVQALQLLRSGIQPELRDPNTLHALQKLSTASLISSKEFQELNEGYRFLREIEHRLQLLHGAQTHELPEDDKEMSFLAKRMGFQSPRAFQSKLEEVQLGVRQIYDSVIQQGKQVGSSLATKLQVSTEELRGIVKPYRFIDPARAVDIVQELWKDCECFRVPKILRMFLKYLAGSGAPDWGLLNFRILSSSDSFRRTADQVVNNPPTLEILVNVCSRSSRLATLLAAEPLLLEALFGRTETFFRPGVDWQFFLTKDPRRFRSFNECKVLVRYLVGESDIEGTTRELSSVADAFLRHVVTTLRARFPQVDDELIVALGKYGGEEISIGSDLDFLILFQRQGEGVADNRHEIAASEFIRAFTSDDGEVYSPDLRLRPEGKSAPLATELSYYREYLNDRAALWEKQAMLKARIVEGNKEIARMFKKLHRATLGAIVHTRGWAKQMLAMKTKMEKERTTENTRSTDLKIGQGGLIDVEFVVQAVQLSNIPKNDSWITVNTFDALKRMAKTRTYHGIQTASLVRNYEFLRQLELAIRLNTITNDFILPEDPLVLKSIAATFHKRSVKELRSKIESVRKENRQMMKKVFESLT